MPLLEVEEVERRVYGRDVRHGRQQRRALQPALRQGFAHCVAETHVVYEPTARRGSEAGR